MADILRAIDPLEYYKSHLSAGVRPDGRGLLNGRKLARRSANLNSTDGSAIIRLGKTTVLAGIQGEPTAPSEAEPSSGRIVISVELPAICSPAAAGAHGSGGSVSGGGKLDREKAVLVELLQRTASGGLVSLDSLCIVEGVAVWSCYCDLVVLEHDGNLTDAAMLAMTCALASGRLPRVVADAKNAGALTVMEEAAVPIRVAQPLYPCTFGVVGGVLVLDPCAEEETLSSSAFTVLVDGKGELRAVHKPGGAPLPDGSLATCVDAARKRLPSLAAVLNKPLATGSGAMSDP